MAAMFGTQEWVDEQKPKGKTILRIEAKRKDGKYAVIYGFMGRPLRKIITQAKLDAAIAEGHYDVIGYYIR